MRASVVLPDPGGPHKIKEKRCFSLMAVAIGLPTLTRCSCPTKSLSVCGRIFEASGSIGAILPPSYKSSTPSEVASRYSLLQQQLFIVANVHNGDKMLGYCDTDCLGRRKIERQKIFARLFNGNIGRRGSFKNFIRHDCRLLADILEVGRVGEKCAALYLNRNTPDIGYLQAYGCRR